MRHRRCIRLLMTVLCAGMLVFALPRLALAAVLLVNPTAGTVKPGDPCPLPVSSAVYTTIQKAVTCAVPGDTIRVVPGIYNENVAIVKPLILLGANAGVDARVATARNAESIVDAGLISAGFSVSAPNVTIDGFRVQRAQNGLNAGIHVGGANNTQILNNIIADNAIGLFVNGGPATIRRNRVESNNRTGTSAGGTGFYSDSSTGLVVSENAFLNQTVNVAVNFAAATANAHLNLHFTDNTIQGNRIGVNLMGTTGALISRNTISANTDGIVFNGGNNGTNVIRNTLITNGTAVRTANPYGVGTSVAVSLNFNRLIDNTIAVNASSGYSGPLNAENNWWGCSYGPGAGGADCTKVSNSVSGSVDSNPWLVLSLTVTPASAGVNGGRVALGASLRKNSLAIDTTGLGYAPDGILAQFSGSMGTIEPGSAFTTNGVATVTFTAGSALGMANITTTLDYQHAANTVAITLNKVFLPLIVKNA